MTHVNPGGIGFVAPPAMLTRTIPHLDLKCLRDGIADRRRRLLDLELAMVAACETEAACGRAASVRMYDRDTWDQATWQRYLAAAAAVEHQYGPPMRQFYREIDQLERVMALPVAQRIAA